MVGAIVSLVLLLVVLLGVCYATPSPCTNLRITITQPPLQYNLVWDPPLAASSNYYRVRCLRGCERHTSVQWETRSPATKVPTEALLKSRPFTGSDSDVNFSLGVIYVDDHGVESISANITLHLSSDKKPSAPLPAANHMVAREASTTSTTTDSSSVTSGGAVITTSATSGGSGGANSTTNSTSTTTTGQLTSGSSSTTTVIPTTATSSTSTTSSSTTSSGPVTVTITITLTMTGDLMQFNVTEFSTRLAHSLGVDVQSVHVTTSATIATTTTTTTSPITMTMTNRNAGAAFMVVAQVTYGVGVVLPDVAKVNAALSTDEVRSYLQTNGFTITAAKVDTPCSTIQATTSTAAVGDPHATGHKGKGGVKGPIIAAIVVPVVVVLAAAAVVLIAFRVRRRRWEQRGVELEQIYKSF